MRTPSALSRLGGLRVGRRGALEIDLGGERRRRPLVSLQQAGLGQGHEERTRALRRRRLEERDDGLGGAPASKASSARSCQLAAASERWRTVESGTAATRACGESAARLRHALAARLAAAAMSIIAASGDGRVTRIATFDSRKTRAF